MAPISSQDVPPAGWGPQLTGGGSRTPAPPPQQYAVFFGDGHATVYALDAQTRKLLWKTRVNSHFVVRIMAGTKYYSDATTSPSPKTTDDIMAVDIDTGKLLWSYQATAGDVFMGGCTGAKRSDACPTPLGPDIGNSPILVTLPDVKRVLLGGTKSADVFALDPDNHGTRLDRVNAAGGPVNITGPSRADRSCGAARRMASTSTMVPATAASSPCRQPMANSLCSSTPDRSSRR